MEPNDSNYHLYKIPSLVLIVVQPNPVHILTGSD